MRQPKLLNCKGTILNLGIHNMFREIVGLNSSESKHIAFSFNRSCSFTQETQPEGGGMNNDFDLNLLNTLNALLRTQSVTEAATELSISTPAVSRALARLRVVFNDPLLVRSGRHLVATPRAIQIQNQVAEIIENTQSLLTTRKQFDTISLSRSFTILASESVICTIAEPLLQLLAEQAPSAKVFFIKGGPNDLSLRDSQIDIEIRSIRHRDSETQAEHVLSDRLIGVVRRDNPLLASPITIASFARAEHVLHSRRGSISTNLDKRLAELGLSRQVVTSVPSLTAVLYLIAKTDLVGTCSEKLTQSIRSTLDLVDFEIPGLTIKHDIDLTWHPRFTNDPAHQWMRNQIKSVFSKVDCEHIGHAAQPNTSN